MNVRKKKNKITEMNLREKYYKRNKYASKKIAILRT